MIRSPKWGFVWLVVLLVCCGGPTFVVQQYAGPQRPRETIAVVRLNGGGPRLATLDREPLVVPERGTRFHIEVVPGVHEIEVEDPNLRYSGVVRFVAEPDKVYRVVVGPALVPNAAGPVWVATAYEVDRASDAELRPAPPANDAPRPPPAPRPITTPFAPDAGLQDAAAQVGD